jgi:predicted nucleic acid-binding protein
MTIVDAGPLVAIIDANEDAHNRCVSALEKLDVPFYTTWAVFTEAMYLLGARVGWKGQELLWDMLLSGALILVELDLPLLQRTRALMAKYRDTPMDFADATLVAAAEDRNIQRIFTLDKDFHVYRLHDRKPFEVVPGNPR